MTTFTATVSAADADDAVTSVTRRLPEGWEVTGPAEPKSLRHLLWNVPVTGDGDRDACWFQLTSYGISPSADLGSRFVDAEH